MEFNKKRFPIKLNIDKAKEIIQKQLNDKGYTLKIKLEDLYLSITPYWFSYYTINPVLKENKEYISSQITLNAVSNKINENIIQIFKYSKPSIIKELNVPKTERTQIKIKKSIVTKEESKKTFLSYLSSKYNVNIDNISLSGIEEIYIPKWKCKTEIGKLELDTILGKINNFYIIKEKDKTHFELLKEMIHDLKSPKKVYKYFISFLKNIFTLIKIIIKNIKIIFTISLLILLIYLIYYLFF